MLELLENICTEDGKRILTVEEKPQISTWGIYEETSIEAPVFLGRSQIETSRIGAFTVINLHAVKHITSNCTIECQSIGRFCMIAHSVHIGFPAHPTSFISGNFVFRYAGPCRRRYFPGCPSRCPRSCCGRRQCRMRKARSRFDWLV